MRPSSHSTRWNGRKLARLRKASLEFTYVAEDGMQNVHTLVVMAENVAGHGDQMSGGEVLPEHPYEMPFDEDFENGSDNFQIHPWVKYQPENDYSANWWVWPTENVIPSGTGNCLVGKPKEAKHTRTDGNASIRGRNRRGGIWSFRLMRSSMQTHRTLPSPDFAKALTTKSRSAVSPKVTTV